MSTQTPSPTQVPSEDARTAARDPGAFDLEDDGFLAGALPADPLDEAPPAHRAAEAPVRDHVLLALKSLVWIVFALFAWAMLSWSWHFLAPGAWHYLAPSQIDKLQNILLVAIISAGVTIATRRVL
jgi:hypothetical protein